MARSAFITESNRVVIIGGGIAGLAAAYRLHQAHVPFTLIEAAPRLGGKIITDRLDGFVIEGGPDTFLAYKPRGIGLCRELGLGDRLQGTNDKIRRTYVMRGGHLHDLPEGLTGLIPTRFEPMMKTKLISPLGKLRMGFDYVIPKRVETSDESLGGFVRRRLGGELYDRMIEPLMSGIYAGDGDQLSLAATFPQLRQTELEHGSLIKGMLANRAKTPPSNGKPTSSRSAFLTPTTGLAEIVEALAQKLHGADLRVKTRVTRVQADAAHSYTIHLDNGESLSAESIIFATPAFITADLCASLDESLATALRGIPYVSTATVTVAYPLSDIPRPLDAYGYIIPRAEGRPILACTWTSTKFPHRAPEGYGLIRAFIGQAATATYNAPQPENMSDEELIDLVRAELRESLGITAEPYLQRIYRWPKAMPQYTLGHLDRLAVIDERLTAHPGWYVAGNAYRGIGLPDCIASGESAADKVVSGYPLLVHNH